MGGREIGSALFNGGGILGLGVVPSDMRSVLILGGRRGPDNPGRSHDFDPFPTSSAVDAVCGLSKGLVVEGTDGPASCVSEEGEDFGMMKVWMGAGCGALGGEPSGRKGGGGFSETNAGALGFN